MQTAAPTMIMDKLKQDKLKQWVLRSPSLLVGSHALERECLRVDPKGKLSLRGHSEVFGHPLTHPEISTDFAECQLELITGQSTSPEEAIAHLEEIHRFLYHNLGEEILWPFSAPCRLPENEEEIPLAQYGDSPEALTKTLYRMGLGHRYGRRMQTLSGVHYNFSLEPAFFEAFKKEMPDIEDHQSEVYLHITRNFLRWAWLPTLLFGAAPVFDKSYLPDGHPVLKELDSNTLYAPHATSLRLSEIGYTSPLQAKMAMSYDSVEAFVQDLSQAVNTPSERYQSIGRNPDGSLRQMNDHELQIEAEHYEAIRPKPSFQKGKRPIDALSSGGIAYLEVRCIDLDPTSPNGICAEQFRFLHLMLLSCLAEPSPSIGQEERWRNFVNQNRVALEGRAPGLQIATPAGDQNLLEAAKERLDGMKELAAQLDSVIGDSAYTEALQKQNDKLTNFSLLPSQRIMDKVSSQGFIACGLEAANKWRDYHLAQPYSKELQQRFAASAKRSIKEAS